MCINDSTPEPVSKGTRSGTKLRSGGPSSSVADGKKVTKKEEEAGGRNAQKTGIRPRRRSAKPVVNKAGTTQHSSMRIITQDTNAEQYSLKIIGNRTAPTAGRNGLQSSILPQERGIVGAAQPEPREPRKRPRKPNRNTQAAKGADDNLSQLSSIAECAAEAALRGLGRSKQLFVSEPSFVGHPDQSRLVQLAQEAAKRDPIRAKESHQEHRERSVSLALELYEAAQLMIRTAGDGGVSVLSTAGAIEAAWDLWKIEHGRGLFEKKDTQVFLNYAEGRPQSYRPPKRDRPEWNIEAIIAPAHPGSMTRLR